MDAGIEVGQTETLLRSDKVGDLLKALADATMAFDPIVKDRSNEHFKTKYASLNAYQAATRNPLATNGLVIVQLIHDNVLYTRLFHISEQWIQSAVPLSSTVKGPQVFGGELTYLKRYCYGAILNISADEDDDDGNAAQQEAGKRAPDRRSQPAPRQPPSAAANAFRNAGLPEKSTPAQTAETFAKRAADYLDVETNGTRWLKRLDAVYAQAQSMDDIGAIRAVESFNATMQNAPSLIKSQMEEMEKAACVRITPQFGEQEQLQQHDLEGAGASHNIAKAVTGVADALGAEKPSEAEEREWMPGDP